MYPFIKKVLPYILFGLVLIPVIKPFINPGFFKTDDGNWMVIRSSDFHRSLRDGQFPVRWAGRLNNEFGYPIFNFHYPLPFYLAEIPKAIGFNFVDSIKIVFAGSLVFSFIFCFLWLRCLFSKRAAFLGAAVYLYAPYHLYDIFTRGSLGEAVGFIFLPLILYAVNSRKNELLSISLALLILSHNTFALISIPLIVIYGLILYKKNNNVLLKFIASLIFGFGLSAFFSIPAVLETKYTVFSQTPVSNFFSYFVDIKDVIFSDFYPSLGLVSITILILSTAVLIGNYKSLKTTRSLSVFFLSVFLATFIFVLPQSDIFWKTTGISSLFQFPWRLFSLSVISSAFLGAFVVEFIFTKIKLLHSLLIIVLLTFIFLLSKEQLSDLVYVQNPDSFYTTNESTTTTKDEFMPIWVKEKPIGRPSQKAEIITGSGIIDQIKSNSIYASFRADVKSPAIIRVNTVYFPGWKLMVNGKEAKIDYKNEKGTINFSLPNGIYNIEVKFTRTPIRLVSELISILSAGILFTLITKNRTKKNEFNKS